ncbi:unnamed protein product [Mytilus edulis]|uniref:Uncharacterized protein n=1 Tax=Mytilus edulis TaxID=6550 RepID=A0A8S3PRG6_MYTED|nr:unnamed protein product [Mytilus edulis]
MVNIQLIILVPYVRSVQTAVHHNFPGITWNAARDICKPFGLENRHDYLQAIPDEQEFWIGKAIYKEPTPWIEIIGCFEIWETDDIPFYSVASIGKCKQKCDSEHMGSYFGYRKKLQSNCVCQLKFINQSYRSPIDSCDSSGSFFVYKDYKGPVGMSSDPGNCTTICCDSCNLPSLNINHLEGRRCSSVDTKIVGRCDSSVSESITQSTLSSIDISKGKQVKFTPSQSLTPAKRSKGIFKETTKSVKEDKNQTHFSNTIYQDSNNTSDRTSAVPLSNQMYGLSGANTPVYAVVNKLKKLENTDATYTDTGYGEYDHLHDIQNRKICPNENGYHSHGAPRNEEDQTYDSSDFGNRISNIDVSKGILTKSNTRDYEDTSHVNCSATTYKEIDNIKHKSETAITNQACDIDESVVPVYEEVNEIEIQEILYRNRPRDIINRISYIFLV